MGSQYTAFAKYNIKLQSVIKTEYFDKLSFQHVIYDEVETFRDSKDPQFGYPYGPRKTVLDFIPMDPTLVFNDTEGLTTWESNYLYKSNQIKFQDSQVCLQGNFYEDLRELPIEMIDYMIFLFKGKLNFEKECPGKTF